jgi:hypothetical protein
MGDHFENIHGSTIVTHSELTSSLNHLQQRFGTDTRDALQQMADFIIRTDNAAAGAIFQNFSNEVKKDQPKKHLLQECWDGIMKVLLVPLRSLMQQPRLLAHFLNAGYPAAPRA